MSRGTRAVISYSALRHNFKRVQQLAPQSNIWAVVKADAYGHGAVQAAHTFSDADGYAVATFDEARQLRAAGLTKPILLLEGVTCAEHLIEAAQLGCESMIHCQDQLDHLSQLTQGEQIKVWLKVDTGMHRLGFLASSLPQIRQQIAELESVQLGGVVTHMCCADDLRRPEITQAQLALASQCKEQGEQASFANSASIIKWPETHADWVRPGIMLYGASPFADLSAQDIQLKPAMTLSAPIIALRRVSKGESVGYGLIWTAERDSVIATLAIGYADGYPRHAPSGTPVMLNGQRVATAGRVSMDMTMIDVTDVADVAIGDMAQLWGDELPVDEVASVIGTIGYELLTRVSPRVERLYID
ncbi:alanine racemase [Reinekea thalattae]|uniref:Alanine racemase n=1 Tax=Reinekea thalattae TaxID=2593301 RepID=A0A5C8Z9K7_9GAMM|nr:alanine racemase [Reinekea thalattae]TXR53908.1 alanine racemase [Reinekea thalattae]